MRCEPELRGASVPRSVASDDAFRPVAAGPVRVRCDVSYTLVLRNEGKYTEAVAISEDVMRRCRRIFGNDHPLTARAQHALGQARERLSKS